MASRSVLRSPFFAVLLLLVFFQIAPSIQGLLRHRSDYDRDLGPFSYYDGYNNMIHVPVPVQKIAKALWDSDYKIMSVLVQLRLQQMLDDCYTLQQKHWKEFELRNTSITIFAPQDKSITSPKDVHLDDYVVLLKLDKAAFDAANHIDDPTTPTCSPRWFTSNVFGHSLTLPIRLDTVKITRFEIYKDDQVTVHGVDKLLTTPLLWWSEQIIP